MNLCKKSVFWLFILLYFPFIVHGDQADSVNDAIFLPKISKYYIVDVEPNEYLGYPILYYKDTSLENVKLIDQLLQNSFAIQSIKYYFLIQNYLKNTKQTDRIEAAYVKLSGNKKGSTRKGFYLRKKKEKYKKEQVYYIEYLKDDGAPENFLGSFTQVFPHEMGHVILRLLSNHYQHNLPLSQNMHYSSIVTDFRTAFDEGFSIHFENISRKYDPDPERKVQILKDAYLSEQKIKRNISGYLRDFYVPVRLDYYRLSAFKWYDKFESIRRMDWVSKGKYKYLIKTANFRNVEKAMFFRNSGVRIDSSKFKNYQQVISTEGVIASFFEKLIESKLKNNYQPFNFYKDFFIKSPDCLIADSLFSPVENQYLKIFVVMNKYLDSLTLNQSPLIQFIEGYICEFPEEKGVVMRIFENVSGHYYTRNIGPEIWMLNKNHKHRYYLLDQFGGNKTEYYIFNLNAANKDDLLSFKTLKNVEVDSIISHRKRIGFFRSLNNIDSVRSLSDEAKSLLKNSQLDPNFIANNKNKKFSAIKMFLAIFARLVEKGLFYLLLFITFYYLLFYGKHEVLKVLTIKYVVRKILKLYVLVFLGYFAVLFSSEPLNSFLIISVVFIAVEMLIRKRERNRRDAFYTSFFIIVLIMFSIW